MEIPATDRIANMIEGKSGFAELESGSDLFEKHLRLLAKGDAATLHRRVCQDLFHCSAETWALNGEDPRVVLDLVPQVVSLASESAGVTEGIGQAGVVTSILPTDASYSSLIDLDRIHAALMNDGKILYGLQRTCACGHVSDPFWHIMVKGLHGTGSPPLACHVD